MPRALADPDRCARQLVEAAARRLAEHGPRRRSRPGAWRPRSARRRRSCTRTSTGMDELLAEVWREGFRRFGVALDAPAVTDDPVADWMTQGWGYRHFALPQPAPLPGDVRRRASCQVRAGTSRGRRGGRRPRSCRCSPASSAASPPAGGRSTTCWTAGDVVWATVHGHVLIELPGLLRGPRARSPLATYEEACGVLAVGFGDDPARGRGARSRPARQRATTARLL